MSYDVGFGMRVSGVPFDHYGLHIEWAEFDGSDRNYTSNVSAMWRHAGVELLDFHGRPARKLTPHLAAAIEQMEANPETYRAMNPENGWGDYEGCLDFLRHILKWGRAFPEATFFVSA